MENKTYQTITNSTNAPYINQTFIPSGRVFTSYTSVTKPSLPNYIALTAGDTLGCTVDSCPMTFTQNNIFHQLDHNLIEWRSYQESMPSACFRTNSTPYAVRHNPALYYTDVAGTSCTTRDTPYPGISEPLSPFTFVTPNLDDDMHDGTIAQGDTWLANHVPDYLSVGAIVIITWDEGTKTNPQVLTAEVGPGVPAGVIDSTPYTHYSLLAGVESYFGVVKLLNAKTATQLPLP